MLEDSRGRKIKKVRFTRKRPRAQELFNDPGTIFFTGPREHLSLSLP